jgi:hypothetical protein
MSVIRKLGNTFTKKLTDLDSQLGLYAQGSFGVRSIVPENTPDVYTAVTVSSSTGAGPLHEIAVSADFYNYCQTGDAINFAYDPGDALPEYNDGGISDLWLAFAIKTGTPNVIQVAKTVADAFANNPLNWSGLAPPSTWTGYAINYTARILPEDNGKAIVQHMFNHNVLGWTSNFSNGVIGGSSFLLPPANTVPDNFNFYYSSATWASPRGRNDGAYSWGFGGANGRLIVGLVDKADYDSNGYDFSQGLIPPGSGGYNELYAGVPRAIRLGAGYVSSLPINYGTRIILDKSTKRWVILQGSDSTGSP